MELQYNLLMQGTDITIDFIVAALKESFKKMKLIWITD